MTDLVGADLQVENGSSTLEATPAPSPTYPAEPGYSRDALGNVYREPGQGDRQTNPAGGTAGTQAASSGAQAGQDTFGGQPQPIRPQIDPSILQAYQAAQYRAAAAEARTAAIEQAQWEQAVRQLPAPAQQLAVAQRRLQLSEANVQQAAQRQSQQQQQLEPLFKEIVVSKLVQQYGSAGVNPQMLANFTSPEAMEEFCRAWAVSGRVAANTQRQVAGVDRAASAGSSSRPSASNWRGTSLRDMISSAFE